MTTWRGYVRALGAAARRAERAEQRRAREAAKRFKEQQRLTEIANAEQEVENWKNYVDMLQSVHKQCTEPINWNTLSSQVKPEEPQRTRSNEMKARQKLDAYKPSFIDKTLNLVNKQTRKLEEAVKVATAKDQEEFEVKYKEYRSEWDTWNEIQEIAEGVQKKDIKAYEKALVLYDPFSDIGELGTDLNISFKSEFIDIDLCINSEEVIPDYELKQTSSGKLSKKKMSKSVFNELYQDHLCSSVIRVAREIFAYLPVDFVRINAMTSLLNTATGHLEEKPIISVILPPETINSLNLETIDPSDSMKNFIHNMDFKKTTGFKEVEKVDFKTNE